MFKFLIKNTKRLLVHPNISIQQKNLYKTHQILLSLTIPRLLCDCQGGLNLCFDLALLLLVVTSGDVITADDKISRPTFIMLRTFKEKPAAHLQFFHGTVVCRGTRFEKHCFRQ